MEEKKAMVKRKNKTKKEKIILGIIIVLIIIVDQLTKIYMISKGDITQNTKPAYGIGSNSTFMYVVTNLVILSIIFKFMTTQNEYVALKQKVFLSFILAGGISNVIDRVFRGYVTEFIEIPYLPVWNIADIFVILGWMGTAAIFASFTVNEWRNSKTKKQKSSLDQEEKKCK